MNEDYHERQKNRIESDLTSFADPGGVKVDGKARRFTAEWTMRGEPREATFTASSDRGVTVNMDRVTQSYSAFLAGTRMADLRHVAQMIKRAKRAETFVPTRARRKDANDGAPSPAMKVLEDLLERDESDVTQIIMITGEAGAGKTSVLQELILRQAGKYIQGRTEKLFLYVNAQGRALARLNEALATELQDLKVNLTYHSVSTLARVGLLVPVIDGFDELLGTSGYDDAFNSLAAFLGQLDGYGQLVASARSTYYEEEFLSRADSASTKGHQAWSHVPVEILPWEDADRQDFLEKLAERESLPNEEQTMLRKRANNVFGGNEGLAQKPLFFVNTIKLLRRDPKFSGGDDLLGTLTHGFLEREQAEKLLDRQQHPLLSVSGLERLMSELAEEMWNQETRELDRRSVRQVADYILEDLEIPESTRQIVVERMPTLAFLTPGEMPGNIRFEHEVFFFRFLAQAIVIQYLQGTDLRMILSRSPLPEFVADRFAFELRRSCRVSSLDGLREILGRLSEAGRMQWRRMTQVRENAGLIVLALLREFVHDCEGAGEIAGCRISNVIFPGSNLLGVVLRNCRLVDVRVQRTNLETAEFIGCSARQVLLIEPRVYTGSTRLELDGLRIPAEIHGIREGGRTYYAPEKVMEILRGCGAPVEGGGQNDVRRTPPALRDLFGRLMHLYEKANPVCTGDQNQRQLFEDSHWSELRSLLIEHGIVKVEKRAASGHSKEFLRRRFSLNEIMSGEARSSSVTPQVARFWDSLEEMGRER